MKNPPFFKLFRFDPEASLEVFSSNKGLVWAGYPANIASRLTDMGNKITTENYYEVLRNPINPKALKFRYSLLGKIPNPDYVDRAPFYLTTTEIVELTESQFAQSFVMYDHKDDFFTIGGKMISFKRKERTIIYPPILVTEKVYEGLLAENPGLNICRPIF
ncbi:hypothetical protein [Chryseobacterium sp. SL1]|uniref:hypothetical protein n=1 Tax=Chryseobacterium sp. SL1 TaxID=2995159 RepID=UPI002273CAEC|nr:hypothetical protein [Chryseobacterium sp. SL1]MCY1662584.1 hypothetical protein [Chryseobacterium sp. SL1]